MNERTAGDTRYELPSASTRSGRRYKEIVSRESRASCEKIICAEYGFDKLSLNCNLVRSHDIELKLKYQYRGNNHEMGRVSDIHTYIQRIRFAAAPNLYVNFAVYRYSRRDVDFNARRTLRHISFLDARYTNDSPFVKFIYVWSEKPTIQTWRARAGVVICFQWAERYYVSLSNQIRWFWRMNVTALLVASIT